MFELIEPFTLEYPFKQLKKQNWASTFRGYSRSENGDLWQRLLRLKGLPFGPRGARSHIGCESCKEAEAIGVAPKPLPHLIPFHLICRITCKAASELPIYIPEYYVGWLEGCFP